MMYLTKKALPRRTFLRGAGVALALPFLDAMAPAQTPLAKTAASPKTRLGFIYVPHGAVFDKWTPAQVGKDFTFSPSLEPLAPFRERLVIVSNLASRPSDAAGEAGGEHTRSPSAFLTGAHAKRTGGTDFLAGTSMDQIVASKLGQDTPLPSLELTIEDIGLSGICEDGYSCTYLNTISWTSPTTPLPMERSPRVTFERLVGEGGTAEQRAARLRNRHSILDSLLAEVGKLRTGLDPRDNSRLNDYLDDVREIERRIQKSEEHAAFDETDLPEIPLGVPKSIEDHIRLMFDLQALAYKSEMSRISTFMMGRDLSTLLFPSTGVNEPWHALSHHAFLPEKLAKLAVLNRFHVSMFAYFLDKLKQTPDGDGNLLDHSMILYGSSMGNSQLHDHSPLPMLLAGGAGGRLKGGYHHQVAEKTPLANLQLAMLHKLDLPMERFGDSTGPLEV